MSTDWAALFDTMARELYTPVISDIFDAMGITGQVAKAGIRPMREHHVAVGRAFTLQCVEVSEQPERPYEGLLAAVAAIEPHTVVVVNGHGSVESAFWGELLSTAAKCAGARGVIVDGALRDCRKILEMEFPAFSRGAIPLDALGRIEVIRHQCPVKVGGVLVYPGDIVFADLDGICVIPEDKAEAVITAALEKVRGENTVRDAILQGMKITEAFDKYRIL